MLVVARGPLLLYILCRKLQAVPNETSNVKPQLNLICALLVLRELQCQACISGDGDKIFATTIPT